MTPPTLFDPSDLQRRTATLTEKARALKPHTFAVVTCWPDRWIATVHGYGSEGRLTAEADDPSRALDILEAQVERVLRADAKLAETLGVGADA